MNLDPNRIYSIFINDSKSMRSKSAIFYRNELWLVLTWNGDPTKGWQKPADIVSLASLNIKDLRQMISPPADFQVLQTTPILSRTVEEIRNAGFEVESPCQDPVRFPYAMGVQ